MNLETFKNALFDNGIDCRENEPMKLHTTFKIGGPADVFVCPKSKEEIKTVLSLAKEHKVPCFILGRGSDLLVSDGGIRGAVLSLSLLGEIRVEEKTIICKAGAPLSRVCARALEAGLTGLEFAYGIPGSVGGALYMNAGAYGGQMSDAVVGAYCIDKNGEEAYIAAEAMRLGYRSSAFKENGFVIAEVVLRLEAGEKEKIKAEMEGYLSARASKQPLEYPSAGSTFKRPEGHYAGALIEKNGLKGFSVGDAQVSEKHAGFIINKGSATAAEVKALIDTVRKKVFEGDGIELEPEVIFAGDF